MGTCFAFVFLCGVSEKTTQTMIQSSYAEETTTLQLDVVIFVQKASGPIRGSCYR